MGTGASAGVGAALASMKAEELAELLGSLPPAERQKLAAALDNRQEEMQKIKVQAQDALEKALFEDGDLEPEEGAATQSIEDYREAFVAEESCTEQDWVGTFVDLFSPDDPNPDSRRFIDLDESSGELQVSADTGTEKWGRRFNKESSVNPVLAATDSPCVRKASFLSKVPEDAPVYEAAKAGALDFTLVLGTAFGKKVIKWNGLYDGKGGEFAGKTVLPSDSDNFWEFV